MQPPDPRRAHLSSEPARSGETGLPHFLSRRAFRPGDGRHRKRADARVVRHQRRALDRPSQRRDRHVGISRRPPRGRRGNGGCNADPFHARRCQRCARWIRDAGNCLARRRRLGARSRSLAPQPVGSRASAGAAPPRDHPLRPMDGLARRFDHVRFPDDDAPDHGDLLSARHRRHGKPVALRGRPRR